MDDTDLKILSYLQPNSCLSNVELAKKLGMAPSAALERVKKLEQKGIIMEYPTRLFPKSFCRQTTSSHRRNRLTNQQLLIYWKNGNAIVFYPGLQTIGVP